VWGGGPQPPPTGPSRIPPGEESNNRQAEELSRLVGLEAGADTPSSVCDSGQGSEAPPSLRETQTPNGRGLRQPANLPSEDAGETSKSPEQSENVIENKAPAGAAVRG
jgi:hypothetical protein